MHLFLYAGREVWEDVHPDQKDFIATYLQGYPEVFERIYFYMKFDFREILIFN